MSTPQETLEELLTVTSGDGDLVHLALVVDDTVAGTTLCRLEVRTRLPVQRFQAAGCLDCAEAGLSHGIKAAVEHGQAAVNIERFYASRGGGAGSSPTPPAPPRVPRQPTR